MTDTEGKRELTEDEWETVLDWTELPTKEHLRRAVANFLADYDRRIKAEALNDLADVIDNEGDDGATAEKWAEWIRQQADRGDSFVNPYRDTKEGL